MGGLSECSRSFFTPFSPPPPSETTRVSFIIFFEAFYDCHAAYTRFRTKVQVKKKKKPTTYAIIIITICGIAFPVPANTVESAAFRFRGITNNARTRLECRRKSTGARAFVDRIRIKTKTTTLHGTYRRVKDRIRNTARKRRPVCNWP